MAISASVGSETISQPLSPSMPSMTSVSTRFLEQPSETTPIFMLISVFSVEYLVQLSPGYKHFTALGAFALAHVAS